jgi:hypothetical protein
MRRTLQTILKTTRTGCPSEGYMGAIVASVVLEPVERSFAGQGGNVSCGQLIGNKMLLVCTGKL